MGPSKAQIGKTQQLFYKINDFTSVVTMMDLWGEDNSFRHLPAIFRNKYCRFLYNSIINVFIFALILLEFCAVFKRDNFDAKQTSDLFMFTFSHPLIYTFYLSVLYYKNEAKDLLLCLTVKLKNIYNDDKIERQMVKRAKCYMGAFLLLCSVTLLLYGFNSLLQVIGSDKTFVTLLTIWPDKDDKSSLASLARVIFYILWWVLIIRGSNGYVLAIASTICLSHQFKALYNYFYKLANIFKEENLTQTEKDKKYRKAFVVGIQIHSDTLWCTRQCQVVYGIGYSGQIAISLMSLTVVMLQLVDSERNIINAIAIVNTACVLLITPGIFMWSAGDVTYEASVLATAMYCSGWENCERETAVRIQKLLLIAMAHAQQPVTIRGFGGIMELSYVTYVSIVKSSYSVFSLVY